MYYFMTFTTTLTQEPIIQATCVQLHNTSPKEASTIEELLQLIEKSEVISGPSREELLTIHDEYQSLEYPADEEKSIFLYYIIDHILTPSIESDEVEKIDELLEFESIGMELLISLLPPGSNPDTYLKQLAQEEVIIERLVVIEDFFNSQMELLQNLANNAQDNIRDKFDVIKLEIINLSSKIEGAHLNLQARIHELSHKVEDAERVLSQLTDKSIQVQGKFKKLQTEIKDNHKVF